MRKVLCVLLTAVMLFALSGCNTEDKIGEYDNVPPIMLAVIYTNAAWGHQQEITVIDNEGKVYSRDGTFDSTEDPDWFDIREKGLYERLLDFVENESPITEITVKGLRRVRWNVQYFEEWSKLEMLEYDEDCCDYGVKTLYGMYYDSDGVPQLAELACYGDTHKCRNSSDVKEFAISCGLFKFEYIGIAPM